MIGTLARASVDGAILVALVWLLARVFRLSPATRTALWWCAAAKFIVALAWTSPVEVPVLPVQVDAAPAAVHRVSAPDDELLSSPARRSRHLPSNPGVVRSVSNGLREWSTFAAIAWVFGLVTAALVGVRRWRETARMLGESITASDDVQAEAADLATRLGLRRAPEVRVSAQAETPLVTGLLKPVVLLPANRLDTLTEEQRRMAICHELAHLKRADLWLGCIPAFVERVFFFHPLAHVASREYALAREAACDASVMRTLGAAPQEYGRLLLALGVTPARPGLTAAGAAWSFQNLKRRIAMLQDISVKSTRSRLLTAAIVGLAVVALVPLRLVARPALSQAAAAEAPAAFVDEKVERETAPSQKAEAPAKSQPRRDEKRDLRFVLFSEDGSRTTSGGFESEDIARAERQRRNGEALLWVTDGEREYVIRNADVLREARSLWRNVYRHEFDTHGMRELTHALDSLKLEVAAESAAKALSAVDTAMIADQAKLIADQGRQAAEIGVAVAEQVLRSLKESGLVSQQLDQAKLEHDLQTMEKSAIDQQLRALEKSTDHLGESIERSMRELERNFKGDFDEQMKDMHDRLRDFDFSEFGERMGEFGRSVGEAAKQATDDMRALIERAIANGQASAVR